MEENRNKPFVGEEAFLQEIDSEWDVEQFLAQQRGEPLPQPPVQQQSARVQETPAEERRQPSDRPANRQRTQTATQQRPAAKKQPKKKQKLNYRGLAQLILAALLVVAIIVVLIILIGKIKSGSTVDTPETEATETTLSREDIISGLITRADRLASSYDYDGAVSVLREYGADWMQQPELTDANARYQSAQSMLVKWEDVSKISMLSFHSLIVDPQRAFDGDVQASYYRDYMVTVTEFKAILQELYNKNYILVSIHDLYTLNYGEANTDQAAAYEPAELYLPAGKKPLVLVQDDLNYAPTMTDGNADGYADKDGDGFASKLILDDDGNITCEYITYDGQIQQGDFDLIPVLEAFLRDHPDFTYQGARGILSLTGSDGIFGYHTSSAWKEKLDGATYNAEVEEAKKVADALKSLGWEFASHTYDHISYGDAAQDELTADLKKWKDEVQSIVGETDLLMYPKGGGLYAYDDALFNAIYDNGFRVFCNIDTETTELRFFDTYLRINRTPVGGQWFNGLDEFFSGSKVKDSAR
ncbi:MAG: polysaccharide deacetylase family protein [Oscillospiraceae bacterium]|nr:polysaccharide deacetylase family protein [Oscillospiraceae bacterium]